MKKNLSFNVLDRREEEQLNAEERAMYFEKLREYCINRKLTNTTVGATYIGPKLKKATNYISRKLGR